MNKYNNRYNAAAMAAIAEKQQKLQSGSMRDWWFGGVFKTIVTVIYELTFWLSVAVNFIVINGYFTRIDSLNKMSATGSASLRLLVKNSLRAFIIGSAALITAYVLKKLAAKTKPADITRRKCLNIAFAVFTVLAVAVLAVSAYSALITGNASEIYAQSVESRVSAYAKAKLFGLHLVPLALQLVCTAFLLVMIAKTDNEKKAMYKKETERLFKDFIKDTPSYSQNEWDVFLSEHFTKQNK